MKYSIKVNINRQENANAGLHDASGSLLPVKLESVPVLGDCSDLHTPSGSTSLTADQIKTSIKSLYHITYTVSESLVALQPISGSTGLYTELSGSTDVLIRKLAYNALLGPASVVSGSIPSGSL